MGFWKRLMRVIKANLNALISRAEDPDKILDQVIEDMHQQLREAQEQVASAIADEKRLKKQLSEEQKQMDSWEKRAMRAVEAGDDDLARQALARREEHTKLAQEYEQQWEAQQESVQQLKAALHLLKQKIDEATRKKNLLLARKKRAEAQQMIQSTMSGMQDNSAFDTLDKMTKKVEQMEAQAEAQIELNNSLKDESLESRFRELEAKEGAQDDALAALKAKMGKTPAAETVEEKVEEKVEVREKVPVPREEENW